MKKLGYDGRSAVIVCVFAFAIGCGSDAEPEGSVDSAIADSSASDSSASADSTETSAPDATDVGETEPTCPPPTVSATCVYSGFGTTCNVGCEALPSCRSTLVVTWTGGGYCCSPMVTFTDCICTDGHLECLESPTSTGHQLPTTHCEFCSPADTGVHD